MNNHMSFANLNLVLCRNSCPIFQRTLSLKKEMGFMLRRCSSNCDVLAIPIILLLGSVFHPTLLGCMSSMSL